MLYSIPEDNDYRPLLKSLRKSLLQKDSKGVNIDLGSSPHLTPALTVK